MKVIALALEVLRMIEHGGGALSQDGLRKFVELLEALTIERDFCPAL